MESCPAQTTPNLPIRRHPVKEHPRHNFFLVGILRVSSVQAQNSTVSSFRIFTTAHGLPKLTQPVFSVNARGFFLSCYRLYHPAIASKPFAPQQSQLQQADQQLLPIETVAIRLFSSSESTKITNPPPLSNKYSKSSAPQQSPLQQPERQLLSIETAAIGLFFGSASTKTPPLPTHSSPPNFGVNRVHQLSRIWTLETQTSELFESTN
jgi:hypothetical protein